MSNVLEMFTKRDFVIGVIVIYFLAIVLFFTLNFNSETLHEHCYTCACVRFCCNDKEKCSSKFIKDNFNQSLIPTLNSSDEVDLKIFYGQPKCDLLKLNPDHNWKFDKVNKI